MDRYDWLTVFVVTACAYAVLYLLVGLIEAK